MTIKRITIDARKVRRASAALSADEHEVLRLSAAYGLSNAEIGARLGLSDDEVVRLLARALSKFGRALERQERSWLRFWRVPTLSPEPPGAVLALRTRTRGAEVSAGRAAPVRRQRAP